MRAARWLAITGNSASSRACKPIQITDSTGVGDCGAHLGDRGHGIIGRQSPSRNPPLQKRDLELQSLEPASEEAQRLGSGNIGYLPDRAFPGRRADVHRAVALDPSEGGRAHCFRPSLFGHSSILPDSLE